MFSLLRLFVLAKAASFEAYVVQIHPLLIFFLGMGIALLLLLPLAWTYLHRKEQARQEELEKITKQFIRERIQTESLLEDLDIGVIVYGIDGKLKMSNNRVLDILDITTVPEHINDFLSQFGEDNGLKASQLLGTGRSEGEIQTGKKHVRVTMKDASIVGKSNFATLVITSDITKSIEEDKQRKEFVANVSHELRTPLTIIKTYTESLIDWGIDEKKPEAVKQDLEKILKDSVRMENLINDLLLLSSIDSRGRAMHFTELDLVSTAKAVAERCSLAAEEKHITLECHVLSDIPKIFADRSSIERILLNLVQNAVKYTEDKGEIMLFINRLRDDIIIKVKDNGKGIDERHLKSIFDRFYRVDTTGSRKYGGTGLGLSIAKELVDLHHGKITVQSTLTVGSEFTISLPSIGKLFSQTVFEPEASDEADDVLIQAVKARLVDDASLQGLKKTELQDFTRQELSDLLEPYINNKTEKKLENEDIKEDFAGIISPKGTEAEDAEIKEDTLSDNEEVSMKQKIALEQVIDTLNSQIEETKTEESEQLSESVIDEIKTENLNKDDSH